MSAANALSSDPSLQATPEARAAEPSMEDILASIRRIIADDQSRSLAGAGASRRAASMNVTPPSTRLDRPAPPVHAETPPLEPLPEVAPPVAALPVAVAPPPRPTYPYTTRAIGAAVAASAASATAAAVTAAHLNPVPASMAPAPAPPVEHEDHLSVISEIAKAGVAAILNPETLAVARPAGVAVEPEPDHSGLPHADLQSEEPEADVIPALGLAEAVDPFEHETAEEPGVFALNGYEAEADDMDDAGASEDPLLSAGVGESVESSFQALANSVFMRNTGAVDGMIRDMLRPLLKTWLDDNLPTIVERLVRAEIERVARGGRT